jgi:cell division transport system permease protein
MKPIKPRKPDDLPARWRPAPLLPREPVQDLLLIFVTAVLCFFACLAVLGAVAADRAAGGWTAQLKGSATVIVRPGPTESADAAVERAAETLGGLGGVQEAAVVERSKTEALVRPWLGDAVKTADLPLPRIVAVQFDPKAPPPPGQLASALRRAGIDAVVDDHSQWIKPVVRAGVMARLAAIAAAALIGLAAAAVIAFATRAGLEARRDIVEVLHQTGSEDRFVIGLFQRRLAELAAIAGFVGAAAAALAGALARAAGGAEGLTPVLPIAWTDLLTVLPCPLIAAVIAVVAARATGGRLLARLP